MPSTIPCSLFPLTSPIYSSLFSDWERTVSSKLFDSQVPSISTEELLLPRHARGSLSSSLQRTQLSVKLLSLYDWQNRESFLQRLRTLVPEHLSFHPALSRYELFSPLDFCRLCVSLRPLVQALESCPASGAPWSSAMPPSVGRGRVTATTRPITNCLQMQINRHTLSLVRLVIT